MRNKIEFLWIMLARHDHTILAILAAILLALLLANKAHAAPNLPDPYPEWMRPGFLIVYTDESGEGYVFKGTQRVAHFCIHDGNCWQPPLAAAANHTPPFKPADWIDTEHNAVEYFEDHSGKIYSEYDQLEAVTATFCMAGGLCDDPSSWPWPISHEESPPPRLYFPFVSNPNQG